MKSEDFNFKSASSEITGRRRKSQSRSTNWDRLVYLSILALLVILGGYYLATKILFVRGEGRVVRDRVMLSAPADARIVSLSVEEGDKVSEKDSLFAYRLTSWTAPVDSLRQFRNQRRNIRNKLSDIRNSISLKKKEKAQVRKQLNYYEQRKKVIEKEVKLGVKPADELYRIEGKILEIESNQALINQELLNLRRRMTELKERLKRVEPMEGNTVNGTRELRTQYFLSPVAGKIREVFKYPWEMAFRSDRIMSISRHDKRVFVRALFPEEDTEHLKTGDIIKVIFNNGVHSSGLIREVYLPQEGFLKRTPRSNFEPSNKVIVKIVPVDSTAREIWQKNSNVGVNVSKYIFW